MQVEHVNAALLKIVQDRRKPGDEIEPGKASPAAEAGHLHRTVVFFDRVVGVAPKPRPPGVTRLVVDADHPDIRAELCLRTGEGLDVGLNAARRGWVILAEVTDIDRRVRQGVLRPM